MPEECILGDMGPGEDVLQAGFLVALDPEQRPCRVNDLLPLAADRLLCLLPQQEAVPQGIPVVQHPLVVAGDVGAAGDAGNDGFPACDVDFRRDHAPEH